MPADYVAISVDDAGAGIAPDILGKIFDPSSPPSRSARAPVWGCRRFMASSIRPAERSRWRANSARVQGSRSCCREEIAPLAKHADAVEAAGNGIVLLVEDNPEVASVSTNLLEQLGYTVRRVADAEAALRENRV